ncbi:oxygen-independent coproporphyrinogen III oxidase [Oxalobacteraceae bacterium]|nr:oxygen-independent coproporphyrinogen III oxidase [Oxalobacteraceae bacterium]
MPHTVNTLSAAKYFPSLQFDADIIGKLSQSGPRYTSYPTADRFSAAFNYGDFLDAVVAQRHRAVPAPLSLYLHIPFCESVCYYCGCNKIVTRDHSKAVRYLEYLRQEIALQSLLFDGMNQLTQLHLGGGTPTYLSDAQMGELMEFLRRHFAFAPDEQGEYAIEIDPRTVDAARVHSLRAQGFNRLSLGVQDFEPAVQQAVNRVQSERQTLDVMAAARDAGFRSISVDLIYGLPHQSMDSMRRTLAKVIEANPDRIALYNYAHMPHLFKPQRRIDAADLPTPALKLDLLALSINTLCAAGYEYIGMDHFARPMDDLAVAQRQGRLQRNFQGYSTHAGANLIACGVSAISAVGATYSQNEKELEAYYAALDAGRLPVARGLRLSADDLLRRIVIQSLMCNFELSIGAVEEAYPVGFWQHFAAERPRLEQLAADGLLVIDGQWITVTLRGRLLIRNICMVFDRYLSLAREQEPQAQPQSQPLRYSQTI